MSNYQFTRRHGLDPDSVDLALHVMDLHGYRSWATSVDPDFGLRLRAISGFGAINTWRPGIQPAAVHRNAPTLHHAPHADCSCGYYAYYQPYVDRNQWTRHHLDASAVQTTITGVIRASGIVEMHEEGLRTQYAEILAICKPWADTPYYRYRARATEKSPLVPSDKVMQMYADEYGVPWYPSFDELVKDFPPTHDVEKAPDREPAKKRKETHSHG